MRTKLVWNISQGDQMFSKTTRSAIRMLTHLGKRGAPDPVSPRVLAEELGESPSYLTKVARDLVKSGILKSHRGVSGGVVIGREPRSITLLAIAQACQGEILADFCEGESHPTEVCAFHQACAELHGVIVSILCKWTLAHFIERPQPVGVVNDRIPCWLKPVSYVGSFDGSSGVSNASGEG